MVNAIYSVFEGSINKWAERILALVDQQTKYLQEELDAQIQGIWQDMQVMKVSVDKWTQNLWEEPDM